MTIQKALLEGSKSLSNSSTSKLDTKLLLCHILNCDKTYLISHADQELKPDETKQFQQLIRERQDGKPIAYITNSKEFYGREFYVDERVMIPRPETEEMVEDAIKFLKSIEIVSPPFKGEMSNEEKTEGVVSPTIIDLGTGSGAIAITLALEFPNLQVFGLEISPEALEVAKINHKNHPSPNLTFLKSDLLSAVRTRHGAFPTSAITILANLPYIGTETNHFVSEETDKYEPHLALYGGKDGLELYRRTWKQLKSTNTKRTIRKASGQSNLSSDSDHEAQAEPVFTMFMEIGFSQAEQIEKEAKEAFPDYQVVIKNDLAGLPRTAILLSRD